MILLIDSGNTLVKFGWLDPATGQRETTPLSLAHDDTANLADWLDRLPAQPARAVGVNVAGRERAQALETHLGRRGCAVRWVTSLDHARGVRNAYDPPGQLGPDRWVSLIGLSRRLRNAATSVPAPIVMLATFGTATTIDTLVPDTIDGARPNQWAGGGESGHVERASNPREWVFRGGLILPGPAMMRSALAHGTALLPDADGSLAGYPTHTRQAIATGIAAAQAGALVRQWAVGLEQYGQPPRVYCAGGGWPAIEPEARHQIARAQAQAGVEPRPIDWLPTPVLDGLATMALADVPAPQYSV
ncbi:MAG TPA: type III pantothenate kinase [Burkholderiaceae bacterium]|nr:type III pantothenate kinase [Burkholderiaceae bacterium]